MQDEKFVANYGDVGSSRSSPTQPRSPSLILHSSSPASVLPNPSKMVVGHEGTAGKILPEIPRSMPSEQPPRSTTSQHQQMTAYDDQDPGNLSTATTWEVPVAGSTYFSNNPTSTTKGRSTLQQAFDKSWVQPTIGLTTLLVTLIALFVYSHRSFVMAKWTEKNDMLQACAQLVQVLAPSCA